MAASMMIMGSTAFSAPALAASRVAPSVAMSAITPGDIGTTKPLGVYDPLNLMTTMPDKYRRWQARPAPPPRPVEEN